MMLTGGIIVLCSILFAPASLDEEEMRRILFGGKTFLCQAEDGALTTDRLCSFALTKSDLREAAEEELASIVR
jgi:hypothetical protein